MKNINLNYLKQLVYRKDIGLLFDKNTGFYHRLENDVAKDIFLLLNDFDSIEGIAREMSNIYNVEYDVVSKDIILLFESICELKGLTIGSEWDSIDKGFSTDLDYPLRLEIELTSLCNWDCGFCYNVWKLETDLDDKQLKIESRKLKTKNISKELVFLILDEASENGCMQIRYSGGETMLHPDVMEILEYGAKKGLHQVLFTNGHFINGQNIKKMKESNVKTLLISIHGDKEIHNELSGHSAAYDKSIQAMKLALNEGIEVVAETTLVKRNLDQVLPIISEMYQLGVREFRIMRYVGTGMDDIKYSVSLNESTNIMNQLHQDLINFPNFSIGWTCGQKFCMSELDNPLKKDDKDIEIKNSQLTGHCEAGLIWASISYDGFLRVCPHSNHFFGHVSNGLKSNWTTLRNEVKDVVKERESCSGCEFISKCRGGCHLNHFLSPLRVDKILNEKESVIISV